MTCEPALANSSVLPSGAARATASVAITPPPPPRFSITMSVFNRVCMSEDTRRAIMSTGPPAANGTTTLIESARAGPAKETASAMSAIGRSHMTNDLFVSTLPAALEQDPVGHQRCDGVAPCSTSAMRLPVPAVVSGGSASDGKKPCATISRPGCGGAGWRKSRTT